MRFKEGHMREAELSAFPSTYAVNASNDVDGDADKGDVRKWNVRRGKLSESTSMVHSPVELDDEVGRHFNRMNCSVQAGEALYVRYIWGT